MTSAIALPLFDVLKSSCAASAPSDGGAADAAARMSLVAEHFVAAALDEYRHIKALDEVPEPEAPRYVFDRQVAILLRHMYDQWATYAESLLARIRSVQSSRPVKGLGELNEAIGRTRAMLSVTLEDLHRAEEQFRNGQTISLEEVRRDLRASVQRKGA